MDTVDFAEMPYEELRLLPDGPRKKFWLIKRFGKEIRMAGYEPRELGCKRICDILDYMDTVN